jgi:hypothetical protein
LLALCDQVVALRDCAGERVWALLGPLAVMAGF